MSGLLMLVTWVVAHWSQIVATAGAVATLGQALPPATWAALVARHPRVASVFRLASALGPDVVKVARVIADAWKPAAPRASLEPAAARTDAK